MENLQNNFSKKTKLEDSIENKEGLESFNIQLENKNYTLEYSKYDFEYSENIQKESGILGYERKTINEEALFNLAKDFLLEKGVNLEERNIKNIHDLKIEISKDNRYEWLKYFNNLCIELLSKLSNNEYPYHTNNHQIAANANDAQTQDYKENFIRHKFFLQKIYDVGLIVKHSKSGLNAFDHQVSTKGFQDIEIFDKDTNSSLNQDGRWLKISDTLDYQEKLNRNEVFIASGKNGFNLEQGAFFSSPVRESLSFGFSEKDNLFQDYIYKALNFYIKEVARSKKNEEKYRYTIYDLIKIIISNNKKSEDISFVENKLKEISQKVNINMKDLLNKLLNPEERGFHGTKKYVDLSGRGSHFPEKGEFSRPDAAEYIAKDIAGNNSHNKEKGYITSAPEVRIPIFINNDEIPQLQWGHAKYAHFINEKGLNFFEFKHVDNLPTEN